MTDKNNNKSTFKLGKIAAALALTSLSVVVGIFASKHTLINQVSTDLDIVKHVHIDVVKNKKLIDPIEEARVTGWIKDNSERVPLAIYQGPIDNIYEVSSTSGIFYITSDLRYTFSGSIYDNLEKRDLTKLSNKILKIEKEISGIYNDIESTLDEIKPAIKPVISAPLVVSPKVKSASSVKEKINLQDNLEKRALNQLANAQEQISKKTAGLDAYREKMEARIRERLVKHKAPVSKSAAKAKSQVDKSKIDLSQMQVGSAFVQYKGSTVQKIGFNKAGNKLDQKTAQEQVKKMYKDIASKGDKWSIVYPAIGEEKMGVVVFSDPTCGYCRKLHKDIPELNKAGVTIHYLMYPRALGLGEDDIRASRVLSTMESAWCSESPRDSLDAAYSGRTLLSADCSILKEQGRANFPAREHYFLGRLFSLEGTPMTFTRDGRVFEGYGGASDYLREIGL